ncbi:MAG: metallophosphoesterase [Candidatus Hydrogenedens sp.]|nr:metallophosphoesterase [Candidatus Hydrogenedens sp.]
MEKENIENNTEEKMFNDIDSKRMELWKKRIEVENTYNLREGDELQYFDWIGFLKAKAISLFLKSIGLYNRGRLNATRISLKQVKFIYSELPKELHGFKILFISDLHLSQNYQEWFISGCSLTKQIKTPVDLVLLGGDYRYGYMGSEEFVLPMLRELLEPVESRYGFFGVLGNHDISTIRDKMEDIGIKILVNEGVKIEHQGIHIWIAGVDDPHNFNCADVSLALADAPNDAFYIMLSHSPEVIEESALWGINLYLCGHTHGGQIGFPWVGPLYFNARCKRKYGLGKWSCAKMQGYTTSGFGVTDVPVRYKIYGEIVMITLLKLPNFDELTIRKNEI